MQVRGSASIVPKNEQGCLHLDSFDLSSEPALLNPSADRVGGADGRLD